MARNMLPGYPGTVAVTLASEGALSTERASEVLAIRNSRATRHLSPVTQRWSLFDDLDPSKHVAGLPCCCRRAQKSPAPERLLAREEATLPASVPTAASGWL